MTPLFLAWLESEARLIHSDGCSKVSQFNRKCCDLHDCEFYHGKDAADAYRLFREGERGYWSQAKPVTFEDANRHFRNCHFSHTQLGWLNPMTWWRWRGIVRFSRGAWDAHRAREQAADARQDDV